MQLNVGYISHSDDDDGGAGKGGATPTGDLGVKR
jgi:hypothetical protein